MEMYPMINGPTFQNHSPKPWKCVVCGSDYAQYSYRAGSGKAMWMDCPECGEHRFVVNVPGWHPVNLEPSIRGIAQWYPYAISRELSRMGLTNGTEDLVDKITTELEKVQRMDRKLSP